MNLPRWPKAKRSERAFTLIECLTAMAVWMTIAISIYGGLASGFLILKTAREELRATQILTQKMEAIRLCTWSQLSNCPTSFKEYYYPDGYTNGTQGVTYYGTIQVGTTTNIPTSVAYRSDMRLVTVSICWTNDNGDQPIVHQRLMQTQAARLGMQNYIWGARP